MAAETVTCAAIYNRQISMLFISIESSTGLGGGSHDEHQLL
jgi:hypothetical protein